jgi:NAD(P)-dependent dehydrogenase (short-subunit alcohol dehydrogenase family)
MMNSELLSKFDTDLKVAVIGASGGLGRAFVDHLSAQKNVELIHAFSRNQIKFENEKVESHEIDIQSEQSIQNALNTIKPATLFDIVVVATGFLHDKDISPEKSLRDINIDNFRQVFSVNTFGPALLAKYFLPRLQCERKSVFACLSARVGSISDNHLGGWYAYRASKAALNMILKNAAIEIARSNKRATIIGMQPGTVDTPLSKPFTRNVKEDQLFTPEYSSSNLLKVINDITPEHSGKVFAYDGEEIPA